MPKRKRGYAPRPHLRRTERLVVRLHPQERAQLERDAEQSGKTMARQLRERYGFDPIEVEDDDKDGE